MWGALGGGIELPPVGPYLDEAPARAGNRAAEQQEVLVGTDVDDLEAALGHARVAHLAGAAYALEDARGRGGRADRAGRADVVGAVGHWPAREVVALDRPLEALALRYSGDLHRLALLEDLDGYRLAHLKLARLIAELGEPAERRGVGLLEVAALGLRYPPLLHLAEPQLHGLVAVAVGCANGGHVTGARLDHGDALDAAVLSEDLRHAQLPAKQRGHLDQLDLDVDAGREMVEPL